MAAGNRLSLVDEDEGEGPSEDRKGLKVNEAYARRFTHNKQREDLQRLQELQKRGLVSASDDEDESSEDGEEDDDGMLASPLDAQIFDTLTKIKKKDPSIYSREIKFFDDVEQEEDDSDQTAGPKGEEAEAKKKPVYLKDALAQQLLEDGPDIDEKVPSKKALMTYSKEQQELKYAFLQGVAEAEGQNEEEEGFLKIRKKSRKEEDNMPADANAAPDDGGIMRRLEEYFGKDDALDENEKFLKDYLLNQRWIDDSRGEIPSYDEIVGRLSDDEEELDRQDKFEAEYNFRFEEGMGSQVLGHSRFVDGSVRKKDDYRKKQREKKKEKLSHEAFERREELKRLKNIKKKEILEKLEKIRTVAGAKLEDENTVAELGEADLQEDFDPEEYDQRMREIFGDTYYQADDADENFQGYEEEMGNLDFDVEDEALGLPKILDGPNKFGFAEARLKAKEAQKAVDGEEESTEDNSVEEDEMEQVGKKVKRKKRKVPLREKLAFDKQLEEYYKLDYEDVIGDLPTRFKYRQVRPDMYGLNVSDVLSTDDKELNQYVPLKKLATYTTEEWRPSKYHRLSQKKRKKSALDMPSKKSQKVEVTTTICKDEVKISDAKDETLQHNNGDVKQRKKRRKKNALHLSQSRLIAYGKISLPSKKRRKV